MSLHGRHWESGKEHLLSKVPVRSGHLRPDTCRALTPVGGRLMGSHPVGGHPAGSSRSVGRWPCLAGGRSGPEFQLPGALGTEPAALPTRAGGASCGRAFPLSPGESAGRSCAGACGQGCFRDTGQCPAWPVPPDAHNWAQRRDHKNKLTTVTPQTAFICSNAWGTLWPTQGAK